MEKKRIVTGQETRQIAKIKYDGVEAIADLKFELWMDLNRETETMIGKVRIEEQDQSMLGLIEFEDCIPQELVETDSILIDPEDWFRGKRDMGEIFEDAMSCVLAPLAALEIVYEPNEDKDHIFLVLKIKGFITEGKIAIRNCNCFKVKTD